MFTTILIEKGNYMTSQIKAEVALIMLYAYSLHSLSPWIFQLNYLYTDNIYVDANK